VGTTRVTAIEGNHLFFTALPSSVLNATFNKIKGKRTKDVLKALFERPATQDLVNLRCREDDDVREHFDKLANMREQLSTMQKHARRQVRKDFDAVVSIAIESHCRFRRNESLLPLS
jgi:hypothetical protein